MLIPPFRWQRFKFFVRTENRFQSTSSLCCFFFITFCFVFRFWEKKKNKICKFTCSNRMQTHIKLIYLTIFFSIHVSLSLKLVLWIQNHKLNQQNRSHYSGTLVLVLRVFVRFLCTPSFFFFIYLIFSNCSNKFSKLISIGDVLLLLLLAVHVAMKWYRFLCSFLFRCRCDA